MRINVLLNAKIQTQRALSQVVDHFLSRRRECTSDFLPWYKFPYFSVNYLLIEALERYDYFYGDKFMIECPTRSGNLMRLRDVALELCRRVVSLFLPNEQGRRPCHGDDDRYTYDVFWNNLVLFYEYFHPETGRGCGAR